MKTTTLTGENVWAELTPLLLQGRRRRAAIAYVTVESVLPLRRGDQLIVDAEDATVAAGGTDPNVIGKWLRMGVDVRSFPGLHAKVAVTDRVAVIGSANASAAAQRRLREAVLVTGDAGVRRELRAFLDELARNADALDQEWVKRTTPMFATARKPRGGRPTRRPGTVLPEQVKRLQFLMTREAADAPEEVRRAVTRATRRARRAGQPARFVHEWFEWTGPSDFTPGDLICQVIETGDASGVLAPQQVVDVITVTGRRKRWLILLTDSQLKPMLFEDVLAAVGGDGRRTPLNRWVRNPTALEQILAVWGLRVEA